MRTISFTLVHPALGPYDDTIVVDDDATEAQIEALKQERLSAWAAGVYAQSSVSTPVEVEGGDGPEI